jgi:uncharacterized membrane protein
MNSFTSFNKLLAVFFGFIGALIIARIIYSGHITYIFLSWNIFLAWIPYALSSFFSAYLHKEKWKQLFLFGSWLLFFPNALYIITDLIHLQQTTNVPLWYDAVLLFASSFAGLVMAFLSLRRVESFLENIFSRKMVLLLVPCILFLGSFGVYLGRFQRWNSWNVINDPWALGMDIFSRFLSPHEHWKAWGITLILTALYGLLYAFVKIIPQALETTRPREKQAGL